MNYLNWYNRLKYLWFLLIAITGIVLITWHFQGQVKLQSNIFSLLPEEIYHPEVDSSAEEVMKRFNEKLFLLVESKQQQTLNKVTQYIEQQLQQTKLFNPSPTFTHATDFFQLLFANRANFISENSANLLIERNYNLFLAEALLRLSSPGTIISGNQLKQDPFLLFSDYIISLSAYHPPINDVELHDGYPTLAQNNHWYRLFTIEVNGNLMDINFQKISKPWIANFQQQIEQQFNTKTYLSGALLFATAGTESARSEVSIIGLGSFIGLILLVLLGFLSIRPIITEFFAIVSGCLIAFVVTHFLYGEVHLMTLVFGASLIGISVDFSFYYLFYQASNRSLSGIQVLDKLLPSLLMSLITTILAYICLLITPFIGLRQIAVFSVLGLASAWLTNFFLLPQLAPLNTKLASKLFGNLIKIRTFFLQHRKWVYATTILIAIISTIGLTKITINDDIRQLQGKAPELVLQQQKIQDLFGNSNIEGYFLIVADNLLDLETNEQGLIKQLKKLKDENLINSFNAIGLWLLPESEQLKNRALLQNIPSQLLNDYAAATGIELNLLQQWQAKLTQQIVTFDDLRTNPLSELQLSENQRIVLVDSKEISKLSQLAQQLPQVYYINPTDYLSHLFTDYRDKAQIQLATALLILIILMTLVYGLKPGLKLVLPVMVALLATYATLALLGFRINLFSVMPAFLILGIGVDYAIYFYSTSIKDKFIPISLLMCMLTSILSFGLLSLSSTYAIQSFGIVVLFGVLYSYIFAFILIQPKHIVNINNRKE